MSGVMFRFGGKTTRGRGRWPLTRGVEPGGNVHCSAVSKSVGPRVRSPDLARARFLLPSGSFVWGIGSRVWRFLLPSVSFVAMDLTVRVSAILL